MEVRFTPQSYFTPRLPSGIVVLAFLGTGLLLATVLLAALAAFALGRRRIGEVAFGFVAGGRRGVPRGALCRSLLPRGAPDPGAPPSSGNAFCRQPLETCRAYPSATSPAAPAIKHRAGFTRMIARHLFSWCRKGNTCAGVLMIGIAC